MQIKLTDCQANEVIKTAFYDELRGRVVEAIVVVLEPGNRPIDLTVMGDNGKVGTFRFRGTRYGNLFLPEHIAIGATMELVPIDRPSPRHEFWRVKYLIGSGLTHSPICARDLRKVGYEQYGRALAAGHIQPS